MEQNLQTDLTDLRLQSHTVNLVVTGDWRMGVGWGEGDVPEERSLC